MIGVEKTYPRIPKQEWRGNESLFAADFYSGKDAFDFRVLVFPNFPEYVIYASVCCGGSDTPIHDATPQKDCFLGA